MDGDKFIQYEKEIQIIKDDIQNIEKRINGVPVIFESSKQDISDWLERVCSLLEIHRNTCVVVADILNNYAKSD